MNNAEAQRKTLRLALADGGVARWSQLRRQGLSRRALVGLLDSGEVTRVGRDVYRLADAPLAAFSHWEEVAAKYPVHCVCLLSAARHHGLTTQVPPLTWIALPRGSKPSDPSVRCVQWPVSGPDGSSHRAWVAGVDALGGTAVPVRVTGAARTLVDLCRWRDRLEDGRRVFLEAASEYARQGLDRGELRRLAREFSVQEPIRDALAAWSEFTNSY